MNVFAVERLSAIVFSCNGISFYSFNYRGCRVHKSPQPSWIQGPSPLGHGRVCHLSDVRGRYLCILIYDLIHKDLENGVPGSIRVGVCY